MERDEKRDYLVSLRESTGMTRKDFAIEYNIPYPTITDWELGHRRVPEYLLRLLAYRIGLEKGISYVQEKSSSDKTNFKVSQIDKNNLTSDIVDKLLFTNIEDDGEPVDCIIVLGSIKASKYRVPVAVHEYQKGRANKLLLCGGSVRDFAEGSMQEAEHMYHAAIAMGACEEDIILEKRSTNTVENVLGALMELQTSFWLNKINRVLLVTTTYHMRRSLAIARYLFPKHIEIIPCPADDNNTKRDNWTNSEEGRARATSEVKNIISCVEQGVFPDFEI